MNTRDTKPSRRAGLIARVAMLALAALTAADSGRAQPVPPEASPVLLIEVKGAIGVATSAYIARGLELAQKRDAALVVLRLDTPGGLVTSTRDIIESILGSAVPVAVYVAPSGARAASAGTYIVYASHIAAMAPGTHLGAATPVSLGGPPGVPSPADRERRPGGDKGDNAPTDSSSAMERKIINDAAAYLRSLAQLRGRNADFAEKAVRSAETMTAEEARDAQVIDLLAASLTDFMAAIDGRRVTVAGGAERTLATKEAPVETIVPDWRTIIIGVITDPNVAYLLMLAGIYGIAFEIWNPGVVFPGVIGGISLLLALAAFAVLPVSYAGASLIVLGIALMIAEAFTPGVMALGIGGLIAFVVGSIFLFDPGDIGIAFGVSWPTIAAAAATSGAFFFLVLGFALRARRQPVVTGIEEMIGSRGQVLDWTGTTGHIHLHGEVWQARAGVSLAPGTAVRVARLDGLTAVVEATDAAAPPPSER